MNPPCQRCGKLVYPMEKLKCLDLYWHKPCFKCEVCGMTLNLKNYKGYNKKPYCQAHYPQTKFTTVAETPEMQRLKQLTEQQSQVKYHEKFEEEKGKYTQVADDPETMRHAQNMQNVSSVEYHKGFEETKGKYTQIADDPETMRLSQNMETISSAMYHKQFEEEKGRFTAVADDPELQRLKKNTQLNSAINYHKDFEESKGKYTSVAEDPELKRHMQNSQIMSAVSYQKAFEESKQKYTAVPDDPETRRHLENTQKFSVVEYTREFNEGRSKYTPVHDDVETRRCAKNMDNISAVKYHAEFERQKGTKLSVDTDPEIERTKRNMATISNAEYHNLKQQRNDQEKRRPSDAEQYSQMPYLLQDTTNDDKPRHYSIDAGQPSYVGSLPRQKGGQNTAQSSYAGGSQTLPKKVGGYAYEERRGSNNSDDQFKRPTVDSKPAPGGGMTRVYSATENDPSPYSARSQPRVVYSSTSDVHSTSGSTSKPIGSIFDKDDPLQEDEYYKQQLIEKQRRASIQRKERQLHGFGFVAQPAPVKQASVESAASRNSSSYQDQPAQNRPQSTGAYDYQYGDTGSGYDHHQPGHERHSAYDQYRRSDYEPHHDHHRQEEPIKKRNIYQPTPFSMTDTRVVKSVPQDKAKSSPSAQRRLFDDGQNPGYAVERQFRDEAPKQVEPKVQNVDRQNQEPRKYDESQGFRNDQRAYQGEPQKSYADESRKGYSTDLQRGYRPDFVGDQRAVYPEEPARGYKEPQRGYSEPQQGYNGHQKGHGDPPKGYMETSIGYDDPPKGYSEPPKGYSEPPKGYSEPQKGYSEPPKGYSEPQKGYSEPQKGYSEPQKGYSEPQKGYSEPPRGYNEPQQQSHSEPNRGSYSEQQKGYSDRHSYTEPQKGYKEPQRGYSEDAQSYPAEPKGYQPQQEERARGHGGGYPEPKRDEQPKSQQQKPESFQYGAPQKGYESPRLNNARLGYNDPQKGFVSSEDLRMPDLYPQIHNNIHDPPKSFPDAPQDNPRGYNGQREDPHTPQKEVQKAKNGVPQYLQEQKFQSPYSARSQPKIAYSSVADEPAPPTHKIGSVADLDPHPVRNDYRHSSGNQHGGQPQYQPPTQTQHAPQPHHAPAQQQMSGRGTNKKDKKEKKPKKEDEVFAPNPRKMSGPRSAGLSVSVSTPTDTTSPKISSPVGSALPPIPLGPRYQALYDYNAGDDDEVTFMEGDIIVDTEIIDPGWMMGRVERTGKSGMLPSNYVEELR